MDITHCFAQLAQLQVAHQMRFHRDNAELDARLMRRFQEQVPATEDDTVDDGTQEGEGDGNSESDSQPAAPDGG